MIAISRARLRADRPFGAPPADGTRWRRSNHLTGTTASRRPDNVPEAIATHPSRHHCARGAAAVVLPADVVDLSRPRLSIVAPPSPVSPPGAAPAGSRTCRQHDSWRVTARRAVCKFAQLGPPCAWRCATCFSLTLDCRWWLRRSRPPVLSPRDPEDHFVGRVGLFRQTRRAISDFSHDVLVTVGFDPVEYDLRLWNTDPRRTVIQYR